MENRIIKRALTKKAKGMTSGGQSSPQNGVTIGINSQRGLFEFGGGKGREGPPRWRAKVYRFDVRRKKKQNHGRGVAPLPRHKILRPQTGGKNSAGKGVDEITNRVLRCVVRFGEKEWGYRPKGSLKLLSSALGCGFRVRHKLGVKRNRDSSRKGRVEERLQSRGILRPTHLLHPYNRRFGATPEYEGSRKRGTGMCYAKQSKKNSLVTQMDMS